MPVATSSISTLVTALLIPLTKAVAVIGMMLGTTGGSTKNTIGSSVISSTAFTVKAQLPPPPLSTVTSYRPALSSPAGTAPWTWVSEMKVVGIALPSTEITLLAAKSVPNTSRVKPLVGSRQTCGGSMLVIVGGLVKLNTSTMEQSAGAGLVIVRS